MREHLDTLAVVLRTFLERELPRLGPGWWDKGVIEHLSYLQTKAASEHRWSNLSALDLEALLNVIDGNWPRLTRHGLVNPEHKSWLTESKTINDRWDDEAPGEKISQDLALRDLDTITRVAEALLPGSSAP